MIYVCNCLLGDLKSSYSSRYIIIEIRASRGRGIYRQNFEVRQKVERGCGGSHDESDGSCVDGGASLHNKVGSHPCHSPVLLHRSEGLVWRFFLQQPCLLPENHVRCLLDLVPGNTAALPLPLVPLLHENSLLCCEFYWTVHYSSCSSSSLGAVSSAS